VTPTEHCQIVEGSWIRSVNVEQTVRGYWHLRSGIKGYNVPSITCQLVNQEMSDFSCFIRVLAHYSKGPPFRRLGLEIGLVGLGLVGLCLGLELGLVDFRNSGSQSS